MFEPELIWDANYVREANGVTISGPRKVCVEGALRNATLFLINTPKLLLLPMVHCGDCCSKHKLLYSARNVEDDGCTFIFFRKSPSEFYYFTPFDYRSSKFGTNVYK